MCKLMAKQILESSYFSFFGVLSFAGDLEALLSTWTYTLETLWPLKER